MVVRKNQVLIIAFIFAFIILFLRLLQLQFAEHNKFSGLAHENAATIVREPAPRGIIYDRYGKVLVENRPVFSVRVLPHILSKKSKSEQQRILSLLSSLLSYKVELKVSATEPIIVKDKVALKTAMQISEKGRELEGVVLTSRPIRLVRHGSVASHVLGYVGEIEASELAKMRKQGYRMGDIVGKDGVEKIYDRQIRGVDGGKKVEVDVYGAPIRILESMEPTQGPDMKLTLDIEMQKAVEAALGNQEGAVVVLNANSGEILAMASYPNYDPNVFTEPMQNWRWKELKQKKHPFINRALAIYPPGSVFKVVTLAAALSEEKARASERTNCYGTYLIKNRLAKCWLFGGHGSIDLMEGLVWSCDVIFYDLGRRLGPDLMSKYAKKFGLGMRTGLDLPQEKKGTIPNRAWKEKYLKTSWYEGDSINYGIGQGFVEVTPLQMAVLYASIASGNIYKPYVVAEIKDRQGKVLYKGETEVVGEVPVSSENLKLIRNALKQVVARGTGVAARVAGIPAAGKTGTAENPGKPHAWFVCYAPYDDPEIVISVFVAHGEHGDKASAYVARDILKWYKEHRLKKVYPEERFEGQYILHGNVAVPYRHRYAPIPSAEAE